MAAYACGAEVDAANPCVAYAVSADAGAEAQRASGSGACCTSLIGREGRPTETSPTYATLSELTSVSC